MMARAKVAWRHVVAWASKLAGAADGSAVLLLAELGSGVAGNVRNEVVGVEPVVAQKFKQAAVITVRSRADGGTDRISGRSSILRREIVRLDLELFHSVDRWNVGDAIAPDRAGEAADVVVDAVDEDV